MEDVVIPDTFKGKPVTYIYQGAFSYSLYHNFKTIHLGKNIRSINPYAFSDCYELESITIDENNPYLVIKNKALYSKDLSILHYCPSSIEGIFNVEKEVTAINNGAFENASRIVTLNLNVSFQEHTFPISSIFDGLSSLKEINVDSDNEDYSSIDGVLFNKDRKELIKMPLAYTGNYLIPEGVSSIADRSFYDCKDLVSLSFPSSFSSTYLHQSFRNNDSLISFDCNNDVMVSYNGNLYSKDMNSLIYSAPGKDDIELYDGVLTLSTLSIVNDNITSLIIPNSVVTIRENAIDAHNLNSVVLGNGLKNINDYAFGYRYREYNLKKLFFYGTAKDLQKVNVSNNNVTLAKATRYYYSESKPTGLGNYWHYVDNLPTIW